MNKLVKEYQDQVREVDKLETAASQGNANKQQLEQARKNLKAAREAWRKAI